jgi:hypothetical protein
MRIPVRSFSRRAHDLAYYGHSLNTARPSARQRQLKNPRPSRTLRGCPQEVLVTGAVLDRSHGGFIGGGEHNRPLYTVGKLAVAPGVPLIELLL